ncbi:MAG: S8 family serine peptidase, partial [Gemmatimonadetes bacterium]|nr:S8 family serine peptidase [Actinomycetota bacterium]NIY12335.1 S8 family serine peptidase [Gemmatimonadota bacterium]NIT98573.1 S8 family serine peptidase [Actinomycetota bacterium]NIU70758.1 S8 family serine peptidase [Actinomycetota bacterium]NIV58751.1 S8 family serine peptidase [Actinomycetota bacterium]
IEEDAFHRFALDGTVPLVEADVMIAAGFDGSGKTVVVIDSGVDSAHPNFAGKLVDEACFASGGPGPNGDCPNGQDVDFGSGSGTYCTYSDECFHGTHVAGIAVGNGPAYSGVAQGATLISIQVATRVDSEAICGVGESPCPRPAESDMVLAVEEVFDDFRHEHT